MIIYRPHREFLIESLKEAAEFESVDEMKKYIQESWIDSKSNPPFDLDDIVIDEASVFDDERCGWHDSKYVCIKRLGNDIYTTPQCIGSCATDYQKKGVNE